MCNVDNPFQSPLTAISIGPGIRGIERGVNRVVRLREIAFVEREAFIIENLVAEMETGILDPAVIWSDCKTFNAELFRGKINIIIAGYPCQPFSNAGNRKGTEDPRHLWPYIERTIDIIRPDACFFENVRGHITIGLREVVGSLERMGYRVHWGIFSAEETGASHKRERVFILAIRRDLVNPEGCRDSGGIRTLVGQNEELEAQKKSRKNVKSFNAGKEVDNTCSNGLEPEHAISAGRNGIIVTGQEWADSNNDRAQLSNRSETMGHTNNSGLEGWDSGISEECSGERVTWPNGPFGQVSRPGQSQQAWEHPRVISREVESTVGLSAHGYHFREDVLRALGNSVYADTAELAFRTLIQKFL